MLMHKCMNVYLVRAEGVVKKKFPNIFHYLYFSCFEPNADISTLAKRNLLLLLKSDDKQALAIAKFIDKIIYFVQPALSNPDKYKQDLEIYIDQELSDIVYKKLLVMIWAMFCDITKKLNSASGE